MPTVSVVIPVHNGARFIAAAVRSVFDQTFRDLEIIVVNDGSTDDTQNTLDAIEGIDVCSTQTNQGVATARTLGARRARGEWLAFLDADDLWYPQKLAVQLKEAGDHPEVAFFYSDLDAVDENANFICRQMLRSKSLARRRQRPSLITLAFHGQPFPYPSTVLMRRSLFLARGGFNTSFRYSYHEDFELFARIALNEELCFIPQPLVKYRIVHTELRQRNKDRNWPLLLASLWRLWSDDSEKQVQLLFYYSKHFSDRGKMLMRSARYKESREYFRLAFRFQPLFLKNVRRFGLSYLLGVRNLYSVLKRGGKL
jgi:glycosyltransferase involved in cell wall biosynthesis